MGLVFAKIKLSNGIDAIKNQINQLADHEVRHMEVEALVDTCAYMLIINENIMAKLGLEKDRYQIGSISGRFHNFGRCSKPRRSPIRKQKDYK